MVRAHNTGARIEQHRTVMKKAILSILAFISLSSRGFGQGVITFDGSEGPGLRVFYNSLTDFTAVPDTNIDINAELFYSVGYGEFGQPLYEPLVTLLLSDTTPTYGLLPPGAVEPAAGDITFVGNGTLFDATGNEYQISFLPAGTVVTFMVEAWFGNYSSLDEAISYGAAAGRTGPFQETLSSPSDLLPANISNMPILGMYFIPEPGTMALAGLGFGALLMLGYRER